MRRAALAPVERQRVRQDRSKPLVEALGTWLRAMSKGLAQRQDGQGYTLIQTAKLNDIDPLAWLADLLARLQDHPARR